MGKSDNTDCFNLIPSWKALKLMCPIKWATKLNRFYFVPSYNWLDVSF